MNIPTNYANYQSYSAQTKAIENGTALYTLKPDSSSGHDGMYSYGDNQTNDSDFYSSNPNSDSYQAEAYKTGMEIYLDGNQAYSANIPHSCEERAEPSLPEGPQVYSTYPETTSAKYLHSKTSPEENNSQVPPKPADSSKDTPLSFFLLSNRLSSLE